MYHFHYKEAQFFADTVSLKDVPFFYCSLTFVYNEDKI